CMAEPLRLSEIAKWQYRVFNATPGEVVSASNLTGEKFDLIIDSLIGYSLAGAPSGVYADLILWANSTGTRILALDVPSGLDSTTGTTPGPVIRAETTMTLALPKTGLIPGKTGRLLLADIGIPLETYRRLDLVYVPPFGSRYVVPLHIRNSAKRRVLNLCDKKTLNIGLQPSGSRGSTSTLKGLLKAVYSTLCPRPPARTCS